jgi:hypothetical protein
MFIPHTPKGAFKVFNYLKSFHASIFTFYNKISSSILKHWPAFQKASKVPPSGGGGGF